MSLLASIEAGWAWKGVEPALIVGENDFGNVIFKDALGKFWRLCPEDLECTVVATNREELDRLSHDQEFLHDWYMVALVEEARSLLGALHPGYKYCLKIPGPLGGAYGGANLGVISHVELVAASGSMARQIEHLPDGSKVELKVVE